MINKKIIFITGPSCAGKTTLVKKLIDNVTFSLAKQCTTRLPRLDDTNYIYLSHEEMRELYEKGKFLFVSGDSNIIEKGNFYGVLYESIVETSDTEYVIVYGSYKDLPQIINYIFCGMDIKIINICYYDYKNMIVRLSSDKIKNFSVEEIKRRYNDAICDKEKYKELIDTYAYSIYTDLENEEESFKKLKEHIKGKEKIK